MGEEEKEMKEIKTNKDFCMFKVGAIVLALQIFGIMFLYFLGYLALWAIQALC